MFVSEGLKGESCDKEMCPLRRCLLVPHVLDDGLSSFCSVGKSIIVDVQQ